MSQTQIPIKRRKKLIWHKTINHQVRLGAICRLVTLLLGIGLAQGCLADAASLTLYVFKHGLPTANIEVLVDGSVVGFTDSQGVVVLDIPPGVRALELRDQDLTVLDQSILVHEGELSQWIVNITRGLSSLVDVESSAPEALQGVQVAKQAAGSSGPPGTLTGHLVSADDGKPVEGARIFISGRSEEIRSDSDGRFKVELPAGEYSLSVLHSGFNTQTRDHVAVAPEQSASVDLQLTPAGTELPEFVVTEPYIAGSLASVLEERRTEVAVANILGAEEISKAGDSDAAAALRRVTGLTLVDGRFIYVRGLGERYSSTLLNGANVPSPDPTRRVVPLDLFPTSIVDSIAVKKGYTAELPGEFGGGTVELRTRSLPEQPFLSVELELGYRVGTTLDDGLSYTGSVRDWTGYDGGMRQQPGALRDLIQDGSRLQPYSPFTGRGFTADELAAAGQSLPVIYDVEHRKIPANRKVSVSGGYLWNFGHDVRFGFLAAMEYKDEWLTVQQQRTQYVVGNDVLRPQNDFHFDITQRFINFSSFLTAGLEIGDHNRLGVNWMLLRNSTDRTQVEQGFNVDAEGGDVRFTEFDWQERQMKATQLFGEHTLPGLGELKVHWMYTKAKAGSEEPDTRRYRYDPDRLTPDTTDFIFSLRNDSNQRRWGELDDESDSWKVDFLQPVSLFDKVDIGILAGLGRVDKTRDSSLRRFSFFCRGSTCRDINLLREQSLEDIINLDTIHPGAWQLEEVTNATDSYNGEQTIDAWYAGLDINFGKVLRLDGGFRNETSDLSATTYNLFDPEQIPVITEQSTDDRFPYASATLFLGNNQFRLGYGETINRPDFKEVSPSQYKDPILDQVVIGNPNLDPGFIKHYDLRWDYYFNPGEFISLGAFYKKFDSPIEFVILAAAGDQLVTFANAESADNFGLEFELYKTLDFMGDLWGWGKTWEKIHVNTNYAWIDSQITLSEDSSTIQTSDQRPLQGQSPYVLNFQVGYDDPDREINAALLYNVFGQRIVEVGVQGAPDIKEQPRPSLDFVYSQGFGSWKLKAKIKNLLDPEIKITQGGEPWRVTQPIGREFKVAVEYTFK